MNKATGTILLPTLSAVALFDHELQGQFSDGMWENSGPHDHWKFWCNLEVKRGPEPKVLTERPWDCKKTGYNIAALYEYVGDRMVGLGRMGRAAESIGMESLSYEQAHAVEYMPKTLAEFESLRRGETKHQYDFAQKYIEAVTPELAAGAEADAAPPVDPCLETDHTIVACMRGAGPFGWTASGACQGVPEKPSPDSVATGGPLKRPRGLKDCVRLGYQDEELICCPEGP